MLANTIQTIAPGSASLLAGITIPLNWIVLAQEVSDPDILGQIGDWIKNFVETGQVWAFIVGLVIGFVVRGNIKS